MRTVRLLAGFLLAAATVTATAAVPATAAVDKGPVEAVRLAAVGGSGVSGRATYQGVGHSTVVTVHVTGLRPRATFRAHLNGGTCERPSASTVAILGGRATTKGVGRGTATVRYRGEPLPISTVADGAHVVAIVTGGKMVACAALPGMS